MSATATDHGTTTPAGSALVVLVGASNCDERRFDEPDRFDVTRTAAGHLTFGFGRHFCLGAALARMEGRIALDEILSRVPERDLDLRAARMAPTSTARGWESLPAVVR